MLCPKCQTPNVDTANYCMHCGTSMSSSSSFINTDNPLLAYYAGLLVIALWNIGTTVISRFVSPSSLLYIGLVGIISPFLTILPAFAIRNRTWRIVAIAFSILLIIVSCAKSILWMVQMSDRF